MIAVTTQKSSWGEEKIGKVANLVNGRAFKPTDWGTVGLPIVRIQNLNNPRKPFNYFAGKIDNKHKLENGDILISWSGTPGTSFGAFIWERGEAVLNQHIFRVDLDETRYLKKFFVYAVNWKLDELIRRAHGGVGLRHITKGQLENIDLPIPYPNNRPLSMEFQNQLVNRIDELLSEIKEARELIDEMWQDANEVIQAVLNEIFEEQSLDRSGWMRMKVSEFCDNPQYGYTASATNEPIGPKFLRITDIQNGVVDWNSVPYCSIPDNKIDKYLLEKDDILFARSGATTGKTLLVKECPKAVFASYLIRLQVRKSVLPEFLTWFFQSNSYWKQIKLRGAAQPNMNATLLGKIVVSFPESFEAQIKTIEYLNSLYTEMKKVRASLNHDAELLTQLEQAILERAFQGELTT